MRDCELRPGRHPAGEPDDPHPCRPRRRDAVLAVLDDDTVGSVAPHRPDGVKEEVRCRLAPPDVGRAEDVLGEEPPQPGPAQVAADLLVSAAGADTHGIPLYDNAAHGRMHAGDGFELLVERAPVLRRPVLLPPGRQGPAEVIRDLALDVGLGPPEKAADDLVAGDRPPQGGQRPDVDVDGQALGVDEDAVTVQDDEVGRHVGDPHRRQRPL